MTTGEMLGEIAARKGWPDSTLLDALIGYLANQQADDALRDYLEERPGLPGQEGREYGAECVIPLGNGNTIRTDSYQDNPAGSSYVRVCGPDGREIAYWSYPEWAEDPRLVMGAILGAAASAQVCMPDQPPGEATRYIAHHGVPTLVQPGAGDLARHDHAMPAAIDGRPVRAAFPTPPDDEDGMEHWTVMLREAAGPHGSRYRLCRVRQAGGPADWEVFDGMPGAQDLTWTLATIWFADAVQAEADGREPPPEPRHLRR